MALTPTAPELSTPTLHTGTATVRSVGAPPTEASCAAPDAAFSTAIGSGIPQPLNGAAFSSGDELQNNSRSRLGIAASVLRFPGHAHRIAISSATSLSLRVCLEPRTPARVSGLIYS